jgi:hypothetical protein
MSFFWICLRFLDGVGNGGEGRRHDRAGLQTNSTPQQDMQTEMRLRMGAVRLLMFEGLLRTRTILPRR